MNKNILPTAEGLLRCLQALAEETASIGLDRTHLALQQTIDTCRAETRAPRIAESAAYERLVH